MDPRSFVTEIVTETAGVRSHSHVRPTTTASLNSVSSSIATSTYSSSSSSVSSTTSASPAATSSTSYDCNLSAFWCGNPLAVNILYCVAILAALVGPWMGKVLYDKLKNRQPGPSRSAGKKSSRSSSEFDQYRSGGFGGVDQSRLEAGPPMGGGYHGGHDDGYDDDGMDPGYRGEHDGGYDDGGMDPHQGDYGHGGGYEAQTPGAESEFREEYDDE